VQPRGKIPFLRSHGEHDATTDPGIIDGWARRDPDANIGIAPGKSGLFVLDVDARNFGHESLAALPTLPDTATTLTGGGGLHIWLRRPAELARWSAKALHVPGVDVSGIDLKGICAGYVVVPPSVHPNGRPYLWEASGRVDEVAIADAPPWLVTMILARGNSKRDLTPHTMPVGATSFYLAVAFETAGWLGRQIRPGVFAVRCPTEHHHSQGRPFDGSTVLFAPPPGSRNWRGTFYCSHSSLCSEAWR
jgi:hypothetical protein